MAPLHALLREVELQVAQAETERQRSRAQQAEQHALHDALTGLLNRRALDLLLEQLLPAGPPRTGEVAGCAALMLDLDHFKAVNDHHGHAVGDAVLQGLAVLLQAEVPAAAHVARQGGEEFVVLLPEQPLSQAQALAQHLCARVRHHAQWPSPLSAGAVTLSVGVAVARPGEDGPSLLRRADAALFAAKGGGRDQVALGA